MTNAVWDKKTIKQIVQINYGKSLTKSKRVEGKYNVYGSGGVTGTHRKYLVEGPGIIIGRKGTVGSLYYEPNSFFPIDTTYYIEDDKSYNIYYIYYLLKTLRLDEMNSHSAVPGLNRDAIYNIRVNLPPLPTQQKIAAILYSLDDKIENNRKTCEKLEEIAQAIFKRWYQSNYSVENTKRISNLDIVVTDYVANGSFASLKKNVTYYAQPNYAVLLRLVDYNKGFNGDFVFIDKHAYDFLSKTQMNGGEIIISNVGANVGTVFRVPRLKYKMNLGPNSIMLNSKYNTYLYLLFSSYFGQSLIKSIVTGSAQPKFNKTNFRSLGIVYPSRESVIKLEEQVKGLFSQIDILNMQNKSFILIRNLLLPKLMSGELSVEDVGEIDQ